MIKFLSEHDVTDVIEQDNTQQFTRFFIRYREHIPMGSGNRFHQLTQIHLRMYNYKILLHHILHLHQCQHSLVFVMRNQLPLLCQTHGIYTMRLKCDNRQV